MKDCMHSHVHVCVLVYMYIEKPEEKVNFLLLQKSESQSREDEEGGTTALHCNESGSGAGKSWAATCMYPAQVNCAMAQLYCPKGVQSCACAHAHPHAHIYKNKQAHIQCMLCLVQAMS